MSSPGEQPWGAGPQDGAFASPPASSDSPGPVSEGAGGETDAAGASQPVTRQIHQAAAAEGTLKKLDPTLITCQPERPNAAQKLWNKRAISYYF